MSGYGQGVPERLVLIDGGRGYAHHPASPPEAGRVCNELGVAHCPQQRPVTHTEAVDVDDWQDSASLQSPGRKPRRRRRGGLALPVADDGHHDPPGNVERHAVAERERATKASAGCRSRRQQRMGFRTEDVDVREVPGQPPEPGCVTGVLRAHGCQLAGEPGVGELDHPRVAGADHRDQLTAGPQLASSENRVGEGPRRSGDGSPVASGARLDVVGLERLGQQLVVIEVQKHHRHIRGCPPQRVGPVQHGGTNCSSPNVKYHSGR